MKTITLQTAIQLTIEALLTMGGSFSAYQVTKGIRASVDKDYHISDVDTTVRFDDDLDEEIEYSEIPHDRVKELVQELFENGLFQADVGYVNDGINAYKVFCPVTPTPQVPGNTVQQILNNVANLPAQDWTDKILPYIERKGGASAKQIQSALKIKGITCKQILDELDIDVPTGLTPSKTFVSVGN